MPWPTCESWTGCAPPPPGNFPSRGPVLRGKGSQGVIGDGDEDALGLLHGPSGGSQQRGGTGPQGPGAYAKGARDEGLARGSAAGRAPARVTRGQAASRSGGAGSCRPRTFPVGTSPAPGATTPADATRWRAVMSEDLKQAVLAGLEQTFDKERWFKPVRESVQGLTAAQAAWHSGPERHSIWQMVHHLSHYCRLMLLRLDGAPIPENWRESDKSRKGRGRKPASRLNLSWSGRGDLNPRPQRPERCALNQAALLPAAVILPPAA